MSDIPLVDSSARLVEGSTTPGLVTAGTATDADRTTLSEIETQAAELRASI